MKNSEISKFIHEYCDAFRPDNFNKMEKYFHFPMSLLARGMSLQFANFDEFAIILNAMLSDLAAKGFSYSKIQTLYIHRLADDIAIVSASYKRFNTDGSVLEAIAATYTLRKDAKSAWGIVAIISHEVDKVICTQ